jgi:HEAT repeat protein
MRLRPLHLSLFCALGSGVLFSTAFGHGGTYVGPGDTVPAGGGGSSGGGNPAPGPTTGNPNGGAPGTPTGGSKPGPGGQTGGPGARGQGTPTGAGTGTDLTNWEFWWNLNKDQFLGLRSALYQRVETSDFLGDAPGRRNTLVPSQADIREKVVPALRRALETERHNDIVTGALVALARIGDVRGEDGRSEFEELFKNWLPDRSQEIAETAAVALGILANDSSVRTLADIAGDSETGRKLVRQGNVPLRTRAFATYGLGLVGARTASNTVRNEIVDELAVLLEQPDGPTRDVKVAAIVALGLTPIDWSTNAAFDRRAGASSSRNAQIEYLQDYFRNESNERLVRAHVPGALAHLLTKEQGLPAEGLALREAVVRGLSQKIGEHSREREEVRQSCILALGQLVDLDEDAADADARAELRRMADHGALQEKAFALIALGQIGGRPGSGSGSAKSLNLIRGLLVEKLTGGSTGARPWAALGLGICEREIEDLGSSAFAPNEDVKIALRSALRGASQEIVGAYAIALGIARDTEAAVLLHGRLLDVRESGQQGYVALALGMIGASGSRTEIQRIIRESKYKPDLLRQAAIALGLLGDKSLVPELVAMLADAKSMASQAAVASALGFIGDARSIDPLVEMLQQKQITATARGFAAVALGLVADKESLPWNAKISININYRANTSTLTTPEGTGLLDIL